MFIKVTNVGGKNNEPVEQYVRADIITQIVPSKITSADGSVGSYISLDIKHENNVMIVAESATDIIEKVTNTQGGGN